MPNRLLTIIALVVVLAVAGLAAVFWPTDEGDAAVRLNPSDAAIVARGQEVYKTSCAACHGDRLQGQENWRQRDVDGLLPAPPHDASGHTWHHPDAVLFALTKYGPQGVVGGEYRSAMPGFEDVLSDADILAALSYIKSTWPAENRARHDDINAQYDAETR